MARRVLPLRVVALNPSAGKLSNRYPAAVERYPTVATMEIRPCLISTSRRRSNSAWSAPSSRPSGSKKPRGGRAPISALKAERDEVEDQRVGVRVDLTLGDRGVVVVRVVRAPVLLGGREHRPAAAGVVRALDRPGEPPGLPGERDDDEGGRAGGWGWTVNLRGGEPLPKFCSFFFPQQN